MATARVGRQNGRAGGPAITEPALRGTGWPSTADLFVDSCASQVRDTAVAIIRPHFSPG